MSNQVYSNQQQKYYGQRGITIYTLTADEPVAATDNDVTVRYAQVDVSQSDPGNITTDALGVLTCTAEGMYSVTAHVKYGKQPADPADTQFDSEIAIRLGSGFGSAGAIAFAKIARLHVVNAIPGVATSEPTISVSAVFYIPQGATFSISFQNYNAAHDAVIRENGSQLSITKLA